MEVPEDGGAHRDLRAEVHEVDEDAQLTARFPPPSVLALERAVTGPNLWVRGRSGEGSSAGAADRMEVPCIPQPSAGNLARAAAL